MSDFRLTEYSGKYLQKNFKDNQNIKDIVKEILNNPFHNPDKPKTISRYRGKQKKNCINMEYKAYNLNLRIFYKIFKKEKQVDIFKIVGTPSAHKINILR